MAKTTTVTTSYTSDIVVNGTAIPADKIYANGTQVRRCIVNGKDVIHKFTRTVDKIASDLTFTVTVRFTSQSSFHYFTSPIYVDVTVTDNGSSGFTSLTLIAPVLIFYCENGNQNSGYHNYYKQELTKQSLPIGQKTTLTFSAFNGKYIHPVSGADQATHYDLYIDVIDQDSIRSQLHAYSEDDISDSALANYSQTMTFPRVVEEIISDNTVQEY